MSKLIDILSLFDESCTQNLDFDPPIKKKNMANQQTMLCILKTQWVDAGAGHLIR